MSRKNFGAKPLTYPQPVFIIATYDIIPDNTALKITFNKFILHHSFFFSYIIFDFAIT